MTTLPQKAGSSEHAQQDIQPAGEGPADWGVALICTAGLTVCMIYLYSLGPLIIPISQDLGWTRGQTSAGLTMVSVISVIAAPFVGYNIDRFGSRRIAIAGCILFCMGITLLSQVGSLYAWFGVWGLVAAGSVLMKPTVWMAAVARRFSRRRGLAMGLALSGTGISAALAPVIAGMLEERFDWRTAFLGLGIGSACLLLPLLVLFFKDPVAENQEGGAQKENARGVGVSIADGFRSATFARLAIAGFCVNFTVLGLVVHFVPMLASYDFTAAHAAKLASVIGVFTILARLIIGTLIDRFPAKVIAVIGFLLPLAACTLLLMFDGSQVMAIAIAMLIGASLGAEVDIIAYLSSHHFGARNYGTLFGTITGAISLGIGLGPTAAGLTFDYFESYRPIFFGMLPLIILAVILIATLGPYPDHTKQASQ